MTYARKDIPEDDRLVFPVYKANSRGIKAALYHRIQF